MSAFPTPKILDTTDLSVREVDDLPADVVVSGRPTAEVWAAPPFEGARTVSYGIWVGQPGGMRTDGYPHDEVFVVLDGVVHLESADGTTLEVQAGDTCFMPLGWRGVWRTIAPTRKAYFIVAQPEAEAL